MNLTKSELTPQQVFNFVGYCFDLSLGEVVNINPENLDAKREQYLFSQATHVSDRAPNSHRETGSVGLTLHEASPVALEKSLACARSFGEDHSSAQVTPSPPGLVTG